jgi:hypothetical protein
VPPPGWKPGDDMSSVASDLLVKRQLEQLAKEVNGVKRSSFLTLFFFLALNILHYTGFLPYFLLSLFFSLVE